MNIYLFYNKRSFTTAQNLVQELNNRGYNARYNRGRRFARTPHVVIRWGNSYREAPTNAIILNSAASVKNACDKGRMMSMLRSNEDVRHAPLQFISPDNLNRDGVANLLDDDNMLYVRCSDHWTRRKPIERITTDDLYITKPINKSHEYRVHVFRDRVIGVYEKIPQDRSALIYKDSNCSFRRVDLSDRHQRSSIYGVRPNAKAAISALGLDFGGVDVVQDSNGYSYVLEVNSAPSLNTENIARWCDKFVESLNS